MVKIKTYVLMIAKVYPGYHPRKGELTGFREKILSGEKIHTIQGNYELWKKRAEEINAGKAILSRREWEDRPYFSKQVEIDVLEKIGVQKIILKKFDIQIANEEEIYRFQSIGRIMDIYMNDGFQNGDDFFAWFPNTFDGGIIHFTDFRY